jgi:hypothetical protein
MILWPAVLPFGYVGIGVSFLHAPNMRYNIVDVALQSMLRYLWNRTKVGATKFSSTNGVDYYASLFAFELVAFFMYERVHLAHHQLRHPPAI